MSSDERKTDGRYVTVEYSTEEKRELYDIENRGDAVSDYATDSTLTRLAELIVDSREK